MALSSGVWVDAARLFPGSGFWVLMLGCCVSKHLVQEETLSTLPQGWGLAYPCTQTFTAVLDPKAMVGRKGGCRAPAFQTALERYDQA